MGEPTGLADEQLRALGQLTSISANRDYYLAGGSAIACHLAHRVSRDLDLFSRRPDVNLEDVPRALRENNATVEVVAITDVTLAMRVDGCLVDVVRYPYGLIEPVSEGPLGFDGPRSRCSSNAPWPHDRGSDRKSPRVSGWR